MDLNKIAQKWQKKWEEAKIFEANPDKRKKYFVTFPYPYINAYSHIGHLYTMMRVEAFARYKRMQGFNVLFPQGWHATGSPLVQAAKRVKEREPKQIKIMQDMGFTEKDFKKFEKPEYWIEFFAPEFKKDYNSIGMSIDWRRNFVTTSLNPRYDKFVKWQFNTLKEKGYVVKGRFPVVWDPVAKAVIGDHDRIEGEGETPQEFTLIKFKLGNECLLAATLRPETMYGQTNLWVNPDVIYSKIKSNNEIWIVSKECAKKLEQQDHKISVVGEINGKELIGKKAFAPFVNRELPILPAIFCDPNKGSGIVTSVPSDAPDDWMGLVDLKNNPKELAKYNLTPEFIEKIEVIPIIDSGDLGTKAAVMICEQMGIKSSKDRAKLEEAKHIVYKKGFYEGKMLPICDKFKGMKVEIAKEAMKLELLKEKKAELLHELTGKVVSRGLNECNVKIVSDQWFLNYGDLEWKKLAHKCIDQMKLYPEKSRQQFDYVVDWLKAWACTREAGMGTRLPWDDKWLIESLSDSTIYMAFYTITHILNKISAEQIDDSLFDYVFLNKNSKIKCDKKLADEMKAEFNYWYPLDFRNSGKDLIQNHLTFFVFNHVAIFPKEKWPKGIGVNGWVTVDGQKMSKSLGNMIPLRDVVDKFGVDSSRFTILFGGESLDDPNWDTEMAKSMQTKLIQMIDWASENYNKGRTQKLAIDNWMESKLNLVLKETTEAMEQTLFRTALQKAFFDIPRYLKWYLRRCENKPSKELMNKVVEAQLLLLAPFVPHVCEEAWNKIGKKGFISEADWPKFSENKIQKEDSEEGIRTIIEDIETVMKLAKIDNPKSINVFVSPKWKYKLFDLVKESLKTTRNPKDIIGSIMKTELKQYGQDIMKIVPKLIGVGSVSDFASQETEFKSLKEAKDYLSKEFNAKLEIELADNSKEPKAKNASPGKPAIVII